MIDARGMRGRVSGAGGCRDKWTSRVSRPRPTQERERERRVYAMRASERARVPKVRRALLMYAARSQCRTVGEGDSCELPYLGYVYMAVSVLRGDWFIAVSKEG